MKKKIFIFSIPLFLALIGSCKKNSQDIAPNPVGRWEASKDVGGDSQGSTFFPGNGNIFEFTENTFKKYQSGQIIDSGSYTIVKELYKTFSYRIIFNNNYNSKYFIQLSNGDLIIDSEGIFVTIRLYTRLP